MTNLIDETSKNSTKSTKISANSTKNSTNSTEDLSDLIDEYYYDDLEVKFSVKRAHFVFNCPWNVFFEWETLAR